MTETHDAADDRDEPTDEELREREPERDDRRESVERVAAAWADSEGER